MQSKASPPPRCLRQSSKPCLGWMFGCMLWEVCCQRVVIQCVHRRSPKAKRDTLMEDESKEVREALLSNKGFARLSDLTDLLTSMLSLVKIVNSSSGLGTVFESCIVRDMKNNVLLGVDTVATTYAVFKVQQIAAMPSPIARKREVDALRIAIRQKGGELCPSLEAYASQLSGSPARMG